jgi:tetratricopeptide (TPR) repeat protein
MKKNNPATWWLLGTLATVSLPLAAAETPDHRTDDLIANLASDDASARRSAADQLVALGESVRPDVLAATHSDDPETSAQAKDVLLRLPWSQPDDPPKVKEILDHYANFSDSGAPPFPAPGTVDERKEAVDALAELDNFLGWDALVRLVYEDPDDEVRWEAVHQLRTKDDGLHLIKLRRTDPPADDAPMAALYGIAWLDADPDRAAPLLQQAVDAEFQQAGADNPELDFAVNALVDVDTDEHHLDAAASLLRRQLAHGGPTDRQDVPLPLLDLLVLHANYGPLKGLDQDLQQAANFTGSPKVQYAVARIDLRENRPDQAAAVRQTAMAAGNNSRLMRFDTGKFLSDNGWYDEAASEFKAYLAMPLGDDQDDQEATDANAHFELATLAIAQDDDLTAAQEKKMAMTMVGSGADVAFSRSDSHGRTWPVPQDQIWADIEWHYLRAARKQNDAAGVSSHLAALLKLAPTDEDIAIDIEPMLKDSGRADDAHRLFANAYNDAKARLDADPGNPALMNGLAWLEAKCDENLPEAMKLATAAVTAMPRNSAIIDTLAEVNFHLGDYAKSVELETRALSLDPDDPFMTGQLARFEKAAGKSK